MRVVLKIVGAILTVPAFVQLAAIEFQNRASLNAMRNNMKGGTIK